jgi:FeS assembly SUF system protein
MSEATAKPARDDPPASHSSHGYGGSGSREARDEGGRGVSAPSAAAEPNSLPASSTMPPEELEAFGNELIAALKTVYDPEIPVDIYELGLIYKVDVADNRDVTVDMTLTAPGCPVAGEMPNMVRNALLGVPGIGEVTVNMTFDPPWTPDRMSEEAKLELNMF